MCHKVVHEFILGVEFFTCTYAENHKKSKKLTSNSFREFRKELIGHLRALFKH